MRIAMYVINAVRSHNDCGVQLLPCRSAPVY